MVVGLILPSTVSAETNINVALENTSTDQVVNQAYEGDKLTLEVQLQTTDNLHDPYVLVFVDPRTGLQINPAKVNVYDTATNHYYFNDLQNPFFYLHNDIWIWEIYSMKGDLVPGDRLLLLAPDTTVTDTGKITAYADLILAPDTWPTVSSNTSIISTVAQQSDDRSIDESQDVNRQINDDTTVPMQNTGIPAALAAFGLLSIIGGTLYSRLK